MPFAMTGQVRTGFRLVDGNAELSEQLSVQTGLANGTGSGQANSFWSDNISLPAGDSETIDILSLAVVAFGASGTTGFSAIKHLAIKNASANVGLVLDPGATNGWDQIGETVIGPSGMFILHSPVSGLPTGGSSKTIRITNSDSVVTLDGDTTDESTSIAGLSSTSGLSAGMTITGAGIPSGAKIASITDSTSLVMTAAATATNAAESLDFAWPDAVVQVYIAGILD